MPDTGAGDVGELEADAAHGDVLLCLHHILVQVVGVTDALSCNQGDTSSQAHSAATFTLDSSVA